MKALTIKKGGMLAAFCRPDCAAGFSGMVNEIRT